MRRDPRPCVPRLGMFGSRSREGPSSGSVSDDRVEEEESELPEIKRQRPVSRNRDHGSCMYGKPVTIHRFSDRGKWCHEGCDVLCCEDREAITTIQFARGRSMRVPTYRAARCPKPLETNKRRRVAPALHVPCRRRSDLEPSLSRTASSTRGVHAYATRQLPPLLPLHAVGKQ